MEYSQAAQASANIPRAPANIVKTKLVQLQTFDAQGGKDFTQFIAPYDGFAYYAFTTDTAATFSMGLTPTGGNPSKVTSKIMDGQQIPADVLQEFIWPILEGNTYSLQANASAEVTIQVLGVPWWVGVGSS